MTAFAMQGLVKRWPRLLRVILWLYIVAEVGTFLFLHFLHFRMWEPMFDLAQLEVAPHSIYTMQAMDVPYYTWTHRQGEHKTQVLSYKKDPVYARRKLGVPIQILHDHNYNGCLTMLDKLIRSEMRPEYILTYEFQCASNFYCSDLCMSKFESLALYDIVKTYRSDIEPRPLQFDLYHRRRYLYKVKPEYIPFV